MLGDDIRKRGSLGFSWGEGPQRPLHEVVACGAKRRLLGSKWKMQLTVLAATGGYPVLWPGWVSCLLPVVIQERWVIGFWEAMTRWGVVDFLTLGRWGSRRDGCMW